MPRNVNALEYVKSLHKGGEYIRAVACYKSLLRLEPDNEKIKFYLGLAEIGLKPSRYY